MNIRKCLIVAFIFLNLLIALLLVSIMVFSEETASGDCHWISRWSTEDPQCTGNPAADGAESETSGKKENEVSDGVESEATGKKENEVSDGVESEASGKTENETSDEAESETSGKKENEVSDGKENESSGKKENETSDEAEKKKVRAIYKRHKTILILVNAEHAIRDSYDPSLRRICRGRLQASERIYSSLTKMLSDAGEQGYQFWIASAYRSKEKQQSLINEDVSRGMRNGLSHRQALEQTYQETMPAGYSEHQTGLALDILCSGNTKMDISQIEEPGNRWLRENCSRYGFILRYPENKSAITGVSFEPWHFRYVGKEAAEYMQKEGITLEEFWERMG